MARRVFQGFAAAALCMTLLAGCSDRSSGRSGEGADRPAPARPAAAPASAPAAQAGWTLLLDGTGLGGWRQLGDANWQLADGAVQADSGKGGFLISEGSYGDFELEAEFFADDTANSGIFLRCTDPEQVTPANAYEVNIFDKRPDPTYRTGGIVNVAAPAARIDTANQWNRYEISARGKHLKVTLNGQLTVDVDDDKFARGPVALQYGAGAIKFRNVRIRPL